MKKNKEKHIETPAEKQERWCKNLKTARSFARQAGIKIKKEKKQPEIDW